MANSSMLVLPRITRSRRAAAGSRSRCTGSSPPGSCRTGRRGTGIGQHILERERNTGERSDLLPVRDLGVDAHRGVHCPHLSMCRKACTAGSTSSIRCRWARVTSTELSSRDLILAARSTAVARMIAFTPPPRGCAGPGTGRARWPAHRPALTSRSDGRSTSSRNTFVSGRACDVGSMSSAATSETRATDPRSPRAAEPGARAHRR